METSASFEARYAPLPYPTNQVPYQDSTSPVTAFSGLLQCSRLTGIWSFSGRVGLNAH